MADIELKIKTNGAQEIGKVTNAFTALKKEYKQAQGELAKFEFGTKGYDEALKKVTDLKGKINDLGDAVKIEGTGIERMNQSFGLLKESLVNADLDKAKLAFKGLGQAMSAIPIFLLIEGVKALIENFDDVVGFCKEFFGALNEDEKAIRKLSKELERQTEVSKMLGNEYKRQIELLEAQGVSSDKILEVKKKLIKTQIDEAIATAKLNIAKVKEIQSNDSAYESYMRFWAEKARQLGQDKEAERLEAVIANNKRERAAESIKAAKDAIELVKDLRNQEKVEVAKVTKEHKDKLKDKLEAEKKYSEDLRKLRLENIQDERQKLNAQFEEEIRNIKAKGEMKNALRKEIEIKYSHLISELEQKQAEERKKQEEERAKQEAENRKKLQEAALNDLKAQSDLEVLKAGDDVGKQFDAKMRQLEVLRDIELSNTDLTESQKAAIKERYAKQAFEMEKQLDEQKQQASFAIASQGINAIQGLSDMAFAIKMANTHKGTAEEEKAARKQFQINKGLQISSATISGIQGVINALTAKSVVPEPFATALRIANAVSIGASTAANIAKIAGTQFDNKGLASSVPSSPSASGAGASDPNPTLNKATLFSTGQSQAQHVTPYGNYNANGNTPIVKAIVSEQDITSTQERVAAVKERATI